LLLLPLYRQIYEMDGFSRRSVQKGSDVRFSIWEDGRTGERDDGTIRVNLGIHESTRTGRDGAEASSHDEGDEIA
jgi:hypothetical protein